MSGKILIVDDLVTNRIILKVKLNAACHEVLEASDGAQALEIARRERPQLILLDIGLPGLSGLEVCRQLRSERVTRHTPVILISASNRRESRLEALAAGADDFLPKPLNETVLMARIRSLLRLNQTDAELRQRAETCSDFGLAEPVDVFIGQPTIALVAPDPGQRIGWRRQMSPHLKADYRLLSATEALESAAGEPGIDLYVIAFDPAAPTAALRLIADLRARTRKQGGGICLAMEPVQPDMAALALDLGADDLVPLSSDPQETAIRLRLLLTRQRREAAMRRAVANGLQMAATDPLTGLFNRRYALAQLDRIAARAAQTEQPYAVLVLDIDHFKQVNDRYGHAAGDQVLETLAKRLTTALRPADLLARIGGEEFLVVLPDTGLDNAMGVAHRLCALVADQPVHLAGSGHALQITLSAGLAVTGGPNTRFDLPGQLLNALPNRPGAGTLHGAAGQSSGMGKGTGQGMGSVSGTGQNMGLIPGMGSGLDEAVPERGGMALQPPIDRHQTGTMPGRACAKPAARANIPHAGTGPKPIDPAPDTPRRDAKPRLADNDTGPAAQARGLLARADAALLESKARGRNRIQIASAA